MKNLRPLRERRHITQVRLSIDIGVSQETISAYESGKALPSVPILMKMADFFNVSIDFLLGRTEIAESADKLTVGGVAADERELLLQYRRLTAERKNKAAGFILGLLADAK